MLKSVPPSPELEKKIRNTKKLVNAGESPPKQTTADVLDFRSYALIIGRPARSRAHTLISKGRERAPVVGSRKALVLLVDFSDNAASQNKQHYSDMLFSSGVYSTKSLREYFWDISYRKLNMGGDVSGEGGQTAGWYRAQSAYSYYTNGEYGFGDYPKNAQKLVEDAVDMASSYVNFADYDNDGDGYVDALFIVHAGTGAEVSGNVNDIWSHQWSISPKTVHGVKVRDYSMEPEDGNIGVFCHELGHVFGLPDLYDYDYDSAGVGRWDLMAAGSWLNNGKTPSDMGSWCKLKLGWVNPTTITGQQTVTIKPYATSGQVYRLPVGGASSKEYFLLCNRRRINFDEYLPGEGLMILHVDENQSNNNDQDHYLVDVEQCDGKRALNKNADSGDASDPYPCSANAAFTASTTPGSKAYDGADSRIAVTNIQRSGEDIIATIGLEEAAAKVWYYSRKVNSTFAHHTTQWAWANIDGLGWRRIKESSADGTTNLFAAFCESLGNNRPVHVYADDNFIYTMYMI
ncbi:MAG: M6 family metalloprotease domain-containing protein [Methanosarcinales archaeon]|nr:M6 family metalloprotease domain-containing protein [Methanosarcinales archaeon]